MPAVELSNKQIDEKVLAVLEGCEVTNDTKHGFVIPPQPPTDKNTYKGFNDVLSAIGGKWKTRVGHVFSEDPSDSLAFILSEGKVPAKNPNSYYPTPDGVADALCEELCGLIEKTRKGGGALKVLEPSAGDGSLIRALYRAFTPRKIAYEVDAVEVDERFAAKLLKTEGVSQLDTTDYMSEHAPEGPYDVVIMNPPFAKGGKQIWIDHLMKAVDQLAPGGYLAAIVPASIVFGQTKRHRELDSRLNEVTASIVSINPLPENAFKDAGTGVSTYTIVLQRT